MKAEIICPICQKNTKITRNPKMHIETIWCRQCDTKSTTLLEQYIINGKIEDGFTNGDSKVIIFNN